mmetsp:Transcript_9781/g.13472  ORF Transcript_9781/g.13472 Transcript_9781/m.13472 type:complete len:182 (-) Transcript_9781:98-643(-)
MARGGTAARLLCVISLALAVIAASSEGGQQEGYNGSKGGWLFGASKDDSAAIEGPIKAPEPRELRVMQKEIEILRRLQKESRFDIVRLHHRILELEDSIQYKVELRPIKLAKTLGYLIATNPRISFLTGMAISIALMSRRGLDHNRNKRNGTKQFQPPQTNSTQQPTENLLKGIDELAKST